MDISLNKFIILALSFIVSPALAEFEIKLSVADAVDVSYANSIQATRAEIVINISSAQVVQEQGLLLRLTTQRRSQHQPRYIL